MSDDKNGIPLAGAQDDAFMPANTGKGKAGFGSAFCHAVKKSHNFFSIFLRYDLKLSRPRRFLIYFLRVLGLMTVTSLFYQQIKSDSLSPVQIILTSIASFIFVMPFTIILTCLFKERKKRTSINRRKREKADKRAKCKFWSGVIVSFIYCGLCCFTILLVGLNNSATLNKLMMITFVIQIAQDILLNQVLKVFVHLLMIYILSKKGCSSCRKTILKIIDHNIAAAFA